MRIARGSSGSTRCVGTSSRRSPIERYGPAVWEGVRPSASVMCGSSSGVASRPPRTMSQRNPSAWSGSVSSRSKLLTRRLRAASSRTELKIGSNGKSGSSGKYICVIRRSVKARPKSEKWMCAGRHAFGWFPHG